MVPSSMKAVRLFEYGEPSVLQYIDVPLPEVGECDVLIKVRATSVNKFDVWYRCGFLAKFQLPGREPFPMPFQLGRDVAGEVAAVGAKVTQFKKGDRVVGMVHPACGQCEPCQRGLDNLCINTKLPGHTAFGGYAEYVSRQETEVMLAPEGVSWEKLGCCVWSYSTSWNIVSRRGDLRPGQSVLITGGSGGMGTAAIQLCRLVGASKIIATSGSPTKGERLQQIGVDHVVNYHDADAADQVKSLTNGSGVDLVIDFIGGEMFLLGMNCLRLAGNICLVAGLEATTPLPLNVMASALIGKRIDIRGIRASKRIDNRIVLQFLGEGKIDPVIDRVMPLSEAAKAHEILEKQEHIGKIVLVP